MGRNIKYNAELKINICRRYLNGESATLLANEYGVPHMETIIGWVRRYEILKDNAFTSFNKNKAYSAELKRKVIEHKFVNLLIMQKCKTRKINTVFSVIHRVIHNIHKHILDINM